MMLNLMLPPLLAGLAIHLGAARTNHGAFLQAVIITAKRGRFLVGCTDGMRLPMVTTKSSKPLDHDLVLTPRTWGPY